MPAFFFIFAVLNPPAPLRKGEGMIKRKTMNNNYLDELNESQREAVLYNDGPSLVIAGAGSGKTRVLTYKIAHLMNEG